MRTLPFGAAASVHHFLRVSSFLHSVGLYAGLCWGAYFDDFPLGVQHCQPTGALCRRRWEFFELLGFGLQQLKKLEPFSKVATMLGVELDLGKRDGWFGQSAKQSFPGWRKFQDVSMKFCNVVFVDASKLPSYLGKLQFAEAQLWGTRRGGLP